MSYPKTFPDPLHATNWRDHAACREEDPELFFPDGSTGQWLLVIEEAKAICRRCPAAEWCLQWAFETGQEAGLWGGLSEDERRRMKRRAGRRPTREPNPERAALVFAKTATLAEACRELYERYTDMVDGHLVWTSSKEGVRIQGRDRTYMQIGFQAGHGRWPVGKVQRSCTVHQCIAPECLTDNTIRFQRKKAAERETEAHAGAAV